MGLRNAIEHRRAQALTPYNPEAWLRRLSAANLTSRYPSIYIGLCSGFSADIPPLTHTFSPPNNPSIIEHHNAFEDIVNKEFSKGRYLGPFSLAEVESTLGPIQTAPLSLVLKPGKPGKFHLVQNLSFPVSSMPVPSVNSLVDPDNFPSPYSTFPIVALVLSTLPPGSQAAVRDVAEAYRTIPLHPSQWHALIVRLSESNFAVDTSTCFGFGPSGGIYGNVGSAGADIMRAAGIGPILRWVDDHLFIRIPRSSLREYNQLRRNTASRIESLGGPKSKGGRSWFAGATLPDDQIEEFDEDYTFPLQDLSLNSPRPPSDQSFCYNLRDIDNISQDLGIPWEISKDIPFSDSPTFIGLTWDLAGRTVRLAEAKRIKYVSAIAEWVTRRTHTLNEVQRLHGKLIHAALIFPEGRPYLTNLEAMLSIFDDRPFLPRTPPRGTQEDLKWWLARLSQPAPPSPIPSPQPILDPNAFSDASSSLGIGISIGGRWRAWTLRPRWRGGGRDIGWAEAVGFELLIHAFLHTGPTNVHFKVFGDNQGVIEGWRNGRSRNKPTNDVFKRIHSTLAQARCTTHARYIPSATNPADGLSRGIYPPLHLLIPPFPVPTELHCLIADFDDPLAHLTATP
jgi:hypothetical protein